MTSAPFVNRSSLPRQEFRRGAYEQRTAPADMAVDSSGRWLEGLGSTWTTYDVTDQLGQYRETLVRGAWAESLRKRTPVSQWLHGKDQGAIGHLPIGRVDKVEETRDGLYFRVELHQGPHFQGLIEALRSGSVSGASVRFSVAERGEMWPSKDVRVISKAELYEVGPVLVPMNPAAKVKLRSARLAASARSQSQPAMTRWDRQRLAASVLLGDHQLARRIEAQIAARDRAARA